MVKSSALCQTDEEAVSCSLQVAEPAFGKEVSDLLHVRVSCCDGISFETFPVSNL